MLEQCEEKGVWCPVQLLLSLKLKMFSGQLHHISSFLGLVKGSELLAV